jgi:hypothetical protein
VEQTMTQPRKYDAIRIEFINSNVTLKELSERHNVNYEALRKAAARGKWNDDRAVVSHKVTSQVMEAKLQSRVSELSQFNADDLKMAKALRGLAAKFLNESQNPQSKKITLSEITQIARVVSEAQKIGRLALGASTDNHELTGANQGAIQVTDMPIAEYKAALKQALEDY